MTIRTITLAALVGGMALAGCTPTTVDTGREHQRAGEGAAIGAASGAALGAIFSKNKAKGAIIGAGLGALGGAAIGNNLDRQAADLRSSIGDGRIQIVNQGDYLLVRMPQDILFAVDSTRVSPALQDDLGALAGNLQRYPNSTVQIIGHTDNTGSAAYNRDLSERRAEAVAGILADYGVSYNRLRPIGRGETQPIATNLSAEGRALNRRVDILIRPRN